MFRRINANMYQLRTSQVIQLPRERVFAFFEDPRNLFEITPDWLDFRMIDPDAGARVFEGAGYDYSIKWLPWLWRTRWRSRIRQYSPPERFTDMQITGPYRSWEHLHTFEEVSDGTRIKDIMTYRLPFGLIGKFVHHILIGSPLEDIFSYRAVRIAEWATGNFSRKQKQLSETERYNI